MGKKYAKWDEPRIQRFKEMYPSEDLDTIATEFNIKKSSLPSIASKLGVKRSRCRNSCYSEEEDNIIIDGVSNGETAKEIHILLPHRTVSSISTRIARLGLSTNNYWSHEENELLKELYPKRKIDDLVDMFPNRSRDAIILHAEKLNLKAYVEYYDYSDADYQFIMDNYLNMTDEQIGAVLGRSKNSIKNHRNKIGCNRHDRENVNYASTVEYLRINNMNWKKESMVACGYKCVVTGQRFDQIHHMYSFNNILNDLYNRLGLEKDFNINSLGKADRTSFINEFFKEQNIHGVGVCLENDIHEKFHKMYGYGDNTPEQFEEFILNNYPDSYESLMSIKNN